MADTVLRQHLTFHLRAPAAVGPFQDDGQLKHEETSLTELHSHSSTLQDLIFRFLSPSSNSVDERS